MRCGYVLMNRNETTHFAMNAAEPVLRSLQDDSAVASISEVQLQPGGRLERRCRLRVTRR